MKKKEKQKVSGSAVALAASAVLAAALGVLILWLQSRQEEMGRSLAASIKNYEKMKVMKRKLLENKQPGRGPAPTPTDKPDDLTAYIGKTATKVGLPQQLINNITFEGERNTPPWREYPVSVNLSGLKDQPIPHTAFVTFLETIEKERPYLKSKNLTISFAGMDYLRVQATISWFRRD